MNEQKKVARYNPHGYSVGMRAEHEGQYVTYADYDQLRQRLADADRNTRGLAMENLSLLERAEQAEAKLALAEQDARRMDWMEAHPNELRFEPFSRSGRAWTCCPSTKIGNDGRPHSDVDRFATARAAIDAAIDASGEQANDH